jgi:hypothetical protein
MRTTNRIINSAACLAVATLFGTPAARAQDQPAFEKGKTVAYEITLPRPGVIGSTDPVGYPMRPAISDDDFEKRFLRVTATDSRPTPRGRRIVLQLDEIDKYRRLIFKGLYYAYVDILPEGTRTLCRLKDDRVDADDLGIAARLPFPFTCTTPPVLAFQSNMPAGYLTAMGVGVQWLRLAPHGVASALQVQAAFFNKRGEPSDNLPQTVRWHGAEIADVSRTNATTRILFRETQEWEAPTDWLWKRMERFDEKGYLVMRCVQLTNAPVSQETNPNGTEKK